MPLYEFRCTACKSRFEQITRVGEADYGACPKCKQTGAERLISKFAIGGQGDLRTSTFHGCHGCYTGHHHHHSHESSDSSHSDADSGQTESSSSDSSDSTGSDGSSTSTPPAAE